MFLRCTRTLPTAPRRVAHTAVNRRVSPTNSVSKPTGGVTARTTLPRRELLSLTLATSLALGTIHPTSEIVRENQRESTLLNPPRTNHQQLAGSSKAAAEDNGAATGEVQVVANSLVLCHYVGTFKRHC